MLLQVSKMATANKPVLPTNRHKFKKPIRGKIVSKQQSINNFEDPSVVLKQKEDVSFVKNEDQASEDTAITIKVSGEEYVVTIPMADEGQITQFQTLIADCLNMSGDEFKLFEDNFSKVVEQQFGIHDIEMAEELINIVALIRSEQANQEPSAPAEVVQPQPKTKMEEKQPEPVKPAPTPEAKLKELGCMASITKTVSEFLIKMGTPQTAKS